MESYKSEFIDFMMSAGVLTFGDFTTKSGRKTPYFINTGMFDGIRSFFRIQDPEVVARKTLSAIERNLGYRGIPFSEHFIRLMQGIVPHRLFNFIFGDICGLYTVMDHFIGRK